VLPLAPLMAKGTRGRVTCDVAPADEANKASLSEKALLIAFHLAD
jgi:hypothetical protein